MRGEKVKEHGITKEQIKFGIIAINIKEEQIVHFVGFETEPHLNSYVEIYQELQNDEDFGVTQDMADIFLFPADEEQIEYFTSVV